MSDSPPLYVMCLDNKGYESSLIKNKEYLVIPDTAALLTRRVRIIDESGEDYMYPFSMFRYVNEK